LIPPPGQQPAPTYSPQGVVRDENDARLVGLLLAAVRQSKRLPRRQLIDAVAIAENRAVLGGRVEAQDVDFIAEFRNKHAGIFDSARLVGDRIQSWLRHYEAAGVIRVDSKYGDLLFVDGASLPEEVIVDEDSARTAEILIRAVSQASTRTSMSDGEESAGTSADQA